MSDRLERGYRRLLAAYPRGHRLAYGDEMLGVLLAGARPDQRRPTTADAADLLRGAARAHARSAVTALRRPEWMVALRTTAVLGVLTLLTLSLRRVAVPYWYGYVNAEHWGSFVPPVDWWRAAVWGAVAAALLVRLRRGAAVLAGVAAAVEVAAVAGYPPTSLGDVVWVSPFLSFAVLAAAGLATTAGGRSVVPARTALVAAAAGAVGLSAMLVDVSSDGYGSARAAIEGGAARPAVPWYLAAVVLTVVAVGSVSAPVRRRVLVLLAPVAAGVVPWFGIGWQFSHGSAPSTAQLVVLAGTPPLALAGAAALLNRVERLGELVALGRAAELHRTAGSSVVRSGGRTWQRRTGEGTRGGAARGG